MHEESVLTGNARGDLRANEEEGSKAPKDKPETSQKVSMTAQKEALLRAFEEKETRAAIRVHSSAIEQILRQEDLDLSTDQLRRYCSVLERYIRSADCDACTSVIPWYEEKKALREDATELIARMYVSTAE